MAIFTIQALAGGFLDEDLSHFNKYFDDWCIQFETYEDAMIILETLKNQDPLSVVEITPLSYPKYFFSSLQGTIYLTRQVQDNIICAVEPFMGSSFKIAICNIKTKTVTFKKTNYKTIATVEAAFSNF